MLFFHYNFIIQIEIDQPGVFIEVTLPCIPIAVNGGLTTVHLTTGTGYSV